MMGIVRIYEKNATCGVCFAWEAELSPIGDLGEVFAMLLSESIIQITENYVEQMKICQKCTKTLAEILKFREKVISNMVMVLGDGKLAHQENLENIPLSFCEVSEVLPEALNQGNNPETGSNNTNWKITIPPNIEEPPKVNVEILIDANNDEVMFVEKVNDDETVLLDEGADEEKPIVDQTLEENKKMLLEWLSDDNVKLSANDIKIEGGLLPNQTLPRCDDCNVTFSSVDGYDVHVKTSLNHAVKQFPCELCDLAFRRKAELDGHVVYQHQGGGDYCPKCGKRCLPPYGLSRHLKRTCDRIGEVKKDLRIVTCKLCNKNMKQHSLSQHLKYMHSKQGKVHCFECNKTFNNMKGFKTHKSTVKNHGGRRFVCDYCCRGFRTKANVEVHIKLKHKSGVQFCEHCKKTVRVDFNYHVKRCLKRKGNSKKVEENNKNNSKTHFKKVVMKTKIENETSNSDLLVERTQRKRIPSRKVLENASIKSKKASVDTLSDKPVTKMTKKTENTPQNASSNVLDGSTNPETKPSLVFVEVDNVEYLEEDYL